MTAPQLDQEPVVEVRLDLLASLLETAVGTAVRHVAAGLPDAPKRVLFGRIDALTGLVVGKVVASLSASGHVSRPSSSSTTTEVR